MCQFENFSKAFVTLQLIRNITEKQQVLGHHAKSVQLCDYERLFELARERIIHIFHRIFSCYKHFINIHTSYI